MHCKNVAKNRQTFAPKFATTCTTCSVVSIKFYHFSQSRSVAVWSDDNTRAKMKIISIVSRPFSCRVFCGGAARFCSIYFILFSTCGRLDIRTNRRTSKLLARNYYLLTQNATNEYNQIYKICIEKKTIPPKDIPWLYLFFQVLDNRRSCWQSYLWSLESTSYKESIITYII